jgi:hypothetical protein
MIVARAFLEGVHLSIDQKINPVPSLEWGGLQQLRARTHGNEAIQPSVHPSWVQKTPFQAQFRFLETGLAK